ncbi:STAS-like domain-containing protein [Yeosuana sp.]|uniref:STAS-like domain-containing protein n=1 Tax=Yeosuana sp. TaxID=2529388 RepID=UPI00404AC1A4
MVTINIKEDFSATTGFRTYDDGPKSGLEFFEKLLDNKYKEASEQAVKLKIILDGGEGYTSSFLNEAFRLLGEKYGADLVWNNLLIVSEERPKYIAKIKKSVYEMGK